MPERLSIYQNMIAAWEGHFLPRTERHPQQRLDRAEEEFTELREAVTGYDGTKEAGRRVAEESTDVIIRMLGIIAQVGGNPDHLMTVATQDIYAKYPVTPIRKAIQAGEGYGSVMKRYKTVWRRSHK